MRVFGFVLLILAASPAVADWVKVHENEEWTSYLDPSTLKKDGNIRKEWLLKNRKRRGRNGELSEKSLIEFDCKEGRLRTLTSAIYYDHMASGEIVASAAGRGDWIYVPPGSFGLDLLRFVCAR